MTILFIPADCPCPFCGNTEKTEYVGIEENERDPHFSTKENWYCCECKQPFHVVYNEEDILLKDTVH